MGKDGVSGVGNPDSLVVTSEEIIKKKWLLGDPPPGVGITIPVLLPLSLYVCVCAVPS